MAKLQSNLSKIAEGVDEAVKEALLATAADVVAVSQQLAPVDTGALRQSLGSEPLSATRVRVGTDRDYAPFVEYGTVNSAAQPFLTPAFAQVEETFKKRLGESVQRLIDHHSIS